MKDEEIIVAIAVHCGWTWPEKSNIGLWIGCPPKQARVPKISLPNYLNDLDSMHEAENVLTGSSSEEDSQKSQYAEALILEIAGISEADKESITEVNFFDHIHATAPQRAKAFLRTVGRWKD